MLWRRMGANLVVIELATAVVLLTGAGLLGKSLYKLLHVELVSPQSIWRPSMWRCRTRRFEG